MQSIINKHIPILPGINVYLERRISKPLDTRLRRGRETDRQRQRDRERETETDRETDRQRETENSISNSKTLILKDSSIRFIWTCLIASPCYTAKTERERERGGGGGGEREAVTRLTKQKTTAPSKTEERTQRWKTRPVHNLQYLRLYNEESCG